MELPFSERSKDVIVKTCTAKENLMPQKKSYVCESSAVRKRLPAPNPARLTQAKKFGVLDAKNIIGIFEKKKEEAGIGTSPSFAANNDSNNNLCPILNYEEELKEEMLFVEDLYDIDNYGMNDFCRNALLINKYPPEDTSISQHNNNMQNFTTSHERKNASVQYMPNCNREILRNSTIKEGSAIDTGLCHSNKLSAVSVQCDIEKCNNIDHHTVDSSIPRADHLREREDRLKFLLKKLQGNQTKNSHDRTWDKYINALRSKHRSCDENFVSYGRAQVNRNPSLHRKLESPFLIDDYNHVRRLPRSCESTKRRSVEIESIRAESPSSIDSPMSCFSKIPSYSKFRVTYSPPGSEFANNRRTALCYPSFLSSQMQSREPNINRNKNLSRNIFSIPKPTSNKKRSCFDNPYYDFYTFPEETKRQNGKDIFRHPFQNNLIGGHQTEQEELLISIPEESKYSTKSNINKMRIHSTKTNEDETVKQNDNDMLPIKHDNSGSGTINSIENKLDKLIDSIHALITEVRSKATVEKKSNPKDYVVPLINNLDEKLRYIKYNKINKTKSDPLGISSGNQILENFGKFLANSDIDVKGIISPKNEKSCEIKLIVSSKTRTKSTNTIAIEPSPYHGFPRQSKQIKVSKYVERPRHHRVVCNEVPHALEITVDFLVKEPPKIAEKCDETIHSVHANENESTKPENKLLRAHTSINTEPLSFGEISKETIKKIVSLFPLVEYYWSRLPIPTIGFSRKTVLECEICKQTFANVTELNKHKLMHNFINCGNPNSCLLCQGPLNEELGKRTIKAVIPLPKLFSCRYCGETFTRAYSKQLHELSCGENKNSPDESNSLVVLR